MAAPKAKAKPAPKKVVDPRLWVRQADFESSFVDEKNKERRAPFCRAQGEPIYVNTYGLESKTLEAKGRKVDVKVLTVSGIEVQARWKKNNPDYSGTLDTAAKAYHAAEKKKKDLIVLHFTAGALEGSIGALTQSGYKVSTSFVLARDGTIYQLFDDSFWSYHIGPTAVGKQKWNAHRTVGIEIVNVGPLAKGTAKGTEDKMYLADAEGKPKSLLYCNVSDSDAYEEKDFRGNKYFATFTDAQYTSLNKLLKYLVARHSIAEDKLEGDARYEVMTAKDADKAKGIRSHVNFRGPAKKIKQKDGTVKELFDKWDIGSAFKWDIALDGIWPVEDQEPPEKKVEPAVKMYDVARSTRENSATNTLNARKPWPFSQ